MKNIFLISALLLLGACGDAKPVIAVGPSPTPTPTPVMPHVILPTPTPIATPTPTPTPEQQVTVVMNWDMQSTLSCTDDTLNFCSVGKQFPVSRLPALIQFYSNAGCTLQGSSFVWYADCERCTSYAGTCGSSSYVGHQCVAPPLTTTFPVCQWYDN